MIIDLGTAGTSPPSVPPPAPVPAPAVQAPPHTPWWLLKGDELLNVRICDLGVRIEGSELEPQVWQLYAQLESRGVALRPPCYLGDEWFSPTGVPAIAIPFYLAHPRLKELEMAQMLEVAGGDPESCQMLLRHEAGHAMDHAYKLSEREDYREVFGSHEADYSPETYTPKPYSKSFVQNLPNWYAQSHPDEDFAETFAVWLTYPPEVWRERYKGWNAIEKLEFVDRLMQELIGRKPLVTRVRKRFDAHRSRKTLGRHYTERRKLFAEDFPDFYDADLRTIFGQDAPGEESAAKLMRRHRAALVASIVQWTGQRKYTVSMLVNKLTQRCQKLKLRAPRDSARLPIEIGAYLSALVTTHLYTGKFKRSV
ncbi:MAG: putative zinc-binding metallopeptidase [Acidobacteriota bacterium]